MEPQELVEALLRSDEEAWRRFIAHYGPLVYSVLNRFPMLGDDREDAFQEICLIVHRSLESLRSADKLAVWLYGIAYRHAVDRVRKKRRQEGAGAAADPDRLVDPGPAADERLAGLQQVALLLDLIERLRPRCRGLLRGLYIEDPPLSYEELGRREGMPIGSIGPTRARCLEELRRLWGDVSETGLEPTT